ncbi:DUF7147 family protein [Jeotgalibacillus campisalis]|uniref:DUF7147 domain-containing protein n=1 Tax=Jeotgalibacillus campisalis TaxID=220754 RepID=A0A0C2VUC1_9BACL|nr:hypothetical protein [Jeotgalibacillus campisalis]KIL47603.1 hypothetical protein KR50_17700 [Jeotgalibacillus campisalis]
MIQRFIELGEGYSDLYEFLEIVKANSHRIERILALHTNSKEKSKTSVVAVMKKTDPGNFQALYICREGIPNPTHTPNKRFELVKSSAAEFGHSFIELEVQPSSRFAEKELFFHYLIGILRMNRYISPLS